MIKFKLMKNSKTGKAKKRLHKKREAKYIEYEAEYEDEEVEYEDDEAEYDEEVEYEDDEAEYDEEVEYEDDEAEYDEEAEYEDDEAEYDEEVEYEDDEAEYDEEVEYEDDEAEYDEEVEYEDDEAEYDEEVEYEYGEAEYEDEEVEYEDDEEEYEDDEEPEEKERVSRNPRKNKAGKKRRQKTRNKKNNKKNNKKIAAFEDLKPKLQKFFKEFSAIDAIVAATGLGVLVIAIVTFTMWSNSKVEAAQISDMVEIGEELSNIEVIGESGLLAVADSKANSVVEEEMTTEEATTEEAEEDIEITVNMTSVEKDLKIKFVNKKTNKLISGTEFQVEQTDPNKQTKTVTDDDKDGIIYQTNMTPGTYKIKLLSVDGYTFPDKASDVTVKDKIEYKKIDIADEVKSEAEVNVAKEDTQIKVVEESKLTDTVEFVESTKTAITDGTGSDSGEYEEVKKSDVTDPNTTSSAKNVTVQSTDGYFLRLVSDNEVPEPAPIIAVTGVSIASSMSLEEGATGNLSAEVSPSDAANKNVSWHSSDDSIASVSGGTVTAHKAGTATVTVTTEDGGKTASCTVTVTAKVPETVAVTGVSVDKPTLAINVGSTGKITATVAPDNATKKEVTWSSSDAKIASVSSDGTVTGVAAGTATITVTTTDGSKKAACTVTVSKVAIVLSIDKTNIDLLIKSSTTITPTQTGFVSTPTYTWTSANPKIASVDTKGKVTAVASGKTTITLTAKQGSDTATATATVNVRSVAEDDATTKLKDKAGNQLYVKVDGKYREAVYADYFKFDKFYKKLITNYKYTGWQTIDNVTYYFDKNGNKVTGTQVIQGVQYTFGSDGSLSLGSGTLGIDVSKWNGTINWTAVKNSGVSFAIIRCGYRGSSTGALVQDPKFAANIKGAQAAGIKVGVYFFTQAVNEVEAVEEASMALNLVNGYGLSMPIYIDTEGSGGRADGISAATRTAVCKAFCATVQNGGKTAGVYASKSWFESKLSAGSLSGYKIWLAQYATKPTYGGRYDMWQYTSKGSVGGINGNVDLNILY